MITRLKQRFFDLFKIKKGRRRTTHSVSVALDIGDFSIKALKAFVDEKGRIIPISWWIGELEDREKGISRIIKICAEKIDYRGEVLVTAIGGESVIIRSIDLPYMTDEELRDSIKWEAKKHIPIDISNAVVDYQLMRRDPVTGNLHVILVAVPNEIFESHYNMMSRAGFPPDIVDVEPLALMNSVLLSQDYAEIEDIVLIDIGRSFASFSIFSHDQIYLVRPISITGKRIEEKLLEVKFANVDEIRGIMKGIFKREESQGEKLRRALEDEVRMLENEIRQNVIYYESRRGRVLSKILLAGGLTNFFELSGIQDSLSRRLDLEVEIYDPFKNLRKEGFDVKLTEKEGPLFALAWGLVSRGFRIAKDV